MSRKRRSTRQPKRRAIRGIERLLYDKRGQLLPPAQWPDAVVLLIQTIETGLDGRTTKVGLMRPAEQRELMEECWLACGPTWLKGVCDAAQRVMTSRTGEGQR